MQASDAAAAGGAGAQPDAAACCGAAGAHAAQAAHAAHAAQAARGVGRQGDECERSPVPVLNGRALREQRHVDLSGQAVTDAAVAAVVAPWLAHACTVESLDLSCNQLGDEAATALAEALRVNRSLRSLSLQDNARVTAAGVDAIHGALRASGNTCFDALHAAWLPGQQLCACWPREVERRARTHVDARLRVLLAHWAAARDGASGGNGTRNGAYKLNAAHDGASESSCNGSCNGSPPRAASAWLAVWARLRRGALAEVVQQLAGGRRRGCEALVGARVRVRCGAAVYAGVVVRVDAAEHYVAYFDGDRHRYHLAAREWWVDERPSPRSGAAAGAAGDARGRRLVALELRRAPEEPIERLRLRYDRRWVLPADCFA